MSPVFGKKKSRQKTIAIVDVENGSVGGALVVLAPHTEPSLLAQIRTEIPALRSHSGDSLVKETVHTVRDVLLHLSTVASRLRVHASASSIGEVERVAVFLHAPWVSIYSGEKSLGTDAPESFLSELRAEIEARFKGATVSFHAFGIQAAPLVHSLYGEDDRSLVVSMTGEITELFLSGPTLISAATVPHGFNTMVRTLQSHAGLSTPEAHSALSLLDMHQKQAPHWEEALHAGITHLIDEIGEVARALVPSSSAQPILVIAPRKSSALLARAFAENDSLGESFPGGTVRDIRATHLSPYLRTHASKPDVGLMLLALCAQSRFGIY